MAHGGRTRTHGVEDGESPVADDRDGRGESGGEERGEPVAEGMRVQECLLGIDEEGEADKEGEEGGDDAVEDLLARVLVGELRVEHGEGDRAREVDVSLQEGDDLGTRLWRRHDEHVLGVTQDGVVEEDGKEHEAERQHLLQLGTRRQEARPAAVISCQSLRTGREAPPQLGQRRAAHGQCNGGSRHDALPQHGTSSRECVRGMRQREQRAQQRFRGHSSRRRDNKLIERGCPE